MKDAASCKAFCRSRSTCRRPPRSQTAIFPLPAWRTASSMRAAIRDSRAISRDATVANILQSRCGSSLSGPAAAAVASVAGGGAPAPYSTIFPNFKIPTTCFDPVAVSLLQYVPGAGGSGGVQVTPNKTDRGDQFQIRVDHSINNNQKLALYYYFDDDNTLDPFAKFQASGATTGNFPGVYTTRTQQINTTHTWTIGSTSVNEARFSYFREGQLKFDTPTRVGFDPKFVRHRRRVGVLLHRHIRHAVVRRQRRTARHQSRLRHSHRPRSQQRKACLSSTSAADSPSATTSTVSCRKPATPISSATTSAKSSAITASNSVATSVTRCSTSSSISTSTATWGSSSAPMARSATILVSPTAYPDYFLGHWRTRISRDPRSTNSCAALRCTCSRRIAGRSSRT